MTVNCFDCGAQLIPGPRGGAAQNYYCSNRYSCRQGFNLTIFNGDVLRTERIGEVDDDRYDLYAGDDAIMSMWIVYDHPTDFPTEFVARRHEIVRGGSRPTDEAMASHSLDSLREALVGRGLTCLSRSPHDDPKIVETWL
jgi:hypothetical protein